MSAELGEWVEEPEAVERRRWLRKVLERRVGMVEEFALGNQEGRFLQVWYRRRAGEGVHPAVLEVEHEVVHGVYVPAPPPARPSPRSEL